MVVMALVYIFGIVSGVFLVAMILAAWIHNAARRINEQHQPTARIVTSDIPVARHAKNGHRRRYRTATAAP